MNDKIKENSGYLLINDEKIKTNMSDLVDIKELGSGTCGLVKKMMHKQTGKDIAVKQMRISGVAEENKRILMESSNTRIRCQMKPQKTLRQHQQAEFHIAKNAQYMSHNVIYYKFI